MGRSFHIQGLVRSLLVVDILELVEGFLLSATVGPRWLGCLLLQRAMHPFMATVLFRMAGCDSLRDDVQLHQINRQGGQAGDRPAGEGRSIVGSYGQGQAIFAEGRFKNSPYSLRVRFLYRLAA